MGSLGHAARVPGRLPDDFDVDFGGAGQPHTSRGVISGVLKKKLGLIITSEKIEGRGRVYALR